MQRTWLRGPTRYTVAGALLVLLAGCARARLAAPRAEIVGTWRADNGLATITFRPDGTCEAVVLNYLTGRWVTDRASYRYASGPTHGTLWVGAERAAVIWEGPNRISITVVAGFRDRPRWMTSFTRVR